MHGASVPRLWTPPLRELTPDTSYGFDLIDFAEAIGTPLDPWQQFVAIHGGELLPDGRPRFRVLLVLVARQNGKTTLVRVWTLYWMFIERVPLVLGTSTSRDYAKESWRQVIAMATEDEWLSRELGARPVRETIGEECFTNIWGSRFRFAASNRRAGRSLTVHRRIADELREDRTWDSWNAAQHAMNAVRDAQTVCISNQGDDGAVVLDSLRSSALRFIETGVGDARTGLFEWSAPAGSAITDLSALAMANPDLGGRIDPDALLGQALQIQAAGDAQQLGGFKTEALCMRVHNLEQAIDEEAWRQAGTDEPISMSEHRDRVALCLDVALDASHASLIAAATVDGVTHVEVVAQWHGRGCTRALRAELPGIAARVRPRTIGWFPGGPAAAVTADLRSPSGGRGWAPRRTTVQELTSEVPAVCMGLAEQVLVGQVRHPRDPMLDAHVSAATPLRRGDAWVFTRRGRDPIDGTYALAGAVHLARTVPPARPPLRGV